jgi:hypothetical protein
MTKVDTRFVYLKPNVCLSYEVAVEVESKHLGIPAYLPPEVEFISITSHWLKASKNWGKMLDFITSGWGSWCRW